ncbi:serine hydrolase domain-containing protein [Leeuwenhoekiella marinoflava]|uniref:Beta-lactamase class C n=2 Tax=Leeuwenhoekiella marinoflava TaxID=988 RepID=A0A4Q0PNQ0_9FLAO|nr:serine hydrolase domain-containing protein [Leeuwenhoekiella marinoflava]RXG31742.1 beta-lactamase class C [Leeuwenhoekiella marinoflava]SHF06651.1 beta-lactamase class C [Leeuwenhoekiella marinoflava DSM 3653]
MIIRKPLVLGTFLVLISFFALSSPDFQETQSKKTHAIEFVNPLKIQAQKEAAYIYKSRKAVLAKEIAAYFEGMINKRLIVGAGVSIVQGDSILLKEGFGKRNVFKNDRVDSETVFRLGSLSKGFTGILAGIEVKDGALKWDDKLVDLMPEFQLKSKLNAEKLTLSNVLSHTTGVPYHCYTNLVEDGIELPEIASRFNIINTIARPGKVYSYQNAMFALSGEMMHTATGQTIQQLLQNKIFTPLNMKTASTDYEALIKTNNYAYPHKNTRKGWNRLPVNKKYFNAVAAGGINASAADMGKWMRFLLGHNERVLDSESIARVFKPQVDIPDAHKYYQRWKGHLRSSYAYGWRIHEFVDAETGDQSKMIHHGGSVSDFRNEIALFPGEDLGISVLFNSLTPLASFVIPELHEIVNKVMNIPVDNLELGKLATAK